MSPLTIGVLIFGLLCIGTVVGMALQAWLPDHHTDADSRDTMKLGIGLIATLTALVLGLVTADAKNTFQNMDTSTRTLAADLLTLDRALAQYGPETQDIRLAIKLGVTQRAKRIWELEGAEAGDSQDTLEQTRRFEALEQAIFQLPQDNDVRRWHRERALTAVDTLLQKRWAFQSQNRHAGLPAAFLVALALWLTVIFASFGLFAPRNRTVTAIMLVCGLSVAGSVFLVLELADPFRGVVQISPTPLFHALDMMGQ